MSKSKIIDLSDLLDQAKAIYEVLNNESDIAAVLVATSFLDTTLETLLRHSFIESRITDKMLNQSSGIMGTFSGKCDAAYCTGLISKEIYKDLTKLGEIRNCFAHNHLQTHFDNPEINKLSKELLIPKGMIEEHKDAVSYEYIARSLDNARNCFTITAVMLCNLLLLKGMSLKRRKHESN